MENEKLFDDTLFVKNERPTDITRQQEEQMFIDMAKEIIDSGFSDSELEDVIEDLKVLSLHGTGFDIAKDLEGCGNAEYDFDGEFIDWLDNAPFIRHGILIENVRLWVRAHNPEPKLKVGDALKVIEPLNRIRFLAKDQVIHISKIDELLACYYVSTDIAEKKVFSVPFEIVEANCVVLE